jgi:TPR repeat protein
MQAAAQAAVNFALGRGVPRDPIKANEMLEQSRKLGRHAGISLLHNYATAKLVDDFAVSELEEAVAKASDEAEGEMQLNIARLLTDKKSKDYNPKEAVTWFELAAESGKPWAMLELAFLYSRGDLGKPEPEKAFAWFQRSVGDSEKEVKHYLGVANVVISLHNGIGIAKDVERAKAMAARHRNDEFVSYLTTIGQCPSHVVTFEQWVELTKRWAKEKKDAQAQYLMGLRSEGGVGVRQHNKDAVKWYKKALKAKHGPAARQLGLLYEVKGQHLGMSLTECWNEAVVCYRIGEAAGDAKAAAFLGNMYLDGRGVVRSDDEAKRLFERSLQLDPKLTLAMNNLGALYEARYRVAKADKQEILAKLNLVEAQRHYEKADASEDDYAPHNLGRLHHEGVLGDGNLQKAYEYFDKAAERGHREARFRLGEMHEKGEGVPETPVEAAYHYRLAALDGHPKALERLVTFYLEGKGGAQDFERAQFWLGRMILNGDEMAFARYADIATIREQHEVAVNMFKMLLRATDRAARGIAYDRLSRCYGAGLGVKVSASRAKKYREKALELGCTDTIYAVALEDIRDGKIAEGIAALMRIASVSPGAAFRLGQMHFHGQNLEKDIAKAIAYLRDAAKVGHGEALYFLAGATFNRVEGAPELDEAIRFAKAAEAGGVGKAAALREKLELRKQAEQ